MIPDGQFILLKKSSTITTIKTITTLTTCYNLNELRCQIQTNSFNFTGFKDNPY